MYNIVLVTLSICHRISFQRIQGGQANVSPQFTLDISRGLI